jgi:hypothetical protein
MVFNYRVRMTWDCSHDEAKILFVFKWFSEILRHYVLRFLI